MRAAMVACSVAGTVTSAPLRSIRIRPAPRAVRRVRPVRARSPRRRTGYRRLCRRSSGPVHRQRGPARAAPRSVLRFLDHSAAQGHGLCTGDLGQCAVIFRTIGDQHQRGCLRDHHEELGQHRLADLIDPMGILNDKIAGDSRANNAAFTKAVIRRRRASGSMLG